MFPDRRKLKEGFELGCLRGGRIVNMVYNVLTANQSAVFGLMGRSDWTRSTEFYLLSNKIASL